MLVKEPKHKAVAKEVRVRQSKQGGHFIYINPWKDALRQMLACLRRNEMVCLLADEKKRSSGVYVDFFGHPAATATGPAVFSLRTVVSWFNKRWKKKESVFFD